jgi:methenyltetrahydromethanopterin cyclohydrolase
MFNKPNPTMTLSLNQRAAQLVDSLVANATAYGISVTTLGNGTRLIDCGCSPNATAGYEAGRVFAEICMGGLGRVATTAINLEGWWQPAVTVHTDHPATACLAAQYAGWAVQQEKFFAMGSGPIRALIRSEEIFKELAHDEQSAVAVLCLESRTLPNETVADYAAQKAGVAADQLTILVAPTASTVGGIQISARVVETALHKLHVLGFDVKKIVSGFGTAPIPPIAKNDSRAIGRTNDAILYGGQVHLTVRADDAELEQLVPRVPAATSADYGTPFYETLKKFEFDFYKIDPLLFSPAEIFVANVTSGKTFHAGQLNVSVLRQSFNG